MAESAVNISSTQHKRPNIFELVAQESLVNHFHPAFKSLLTYLAEKNSKVFEPLLKWYDEVFLGANLTLQYFYLKAYKSSFSEAFYGLMRIRAQSESVKGPLPRKVFLASLICLALVPYLKQKLTELSRKYEEEGRFAPESKHKKLLVALLNCNRTVNTVYGTLRLYYIASYAAGLAKVHDPLLKLSGVELIYHHRDLPGWKDLWRALVTCKVSTPKITFKLIFKLLASSLEIGAFFIQFLSWWHSDDSKAGVLRKLPIPKAPHVDNSTTLCPICSKERKNEVVLITSGYVFCYICIKRYLEDNGVCPVTNLPSSVDNLVRIYSSDDI